MRWRSVSYRASGENLLGDGPYPSGRASAYPARPRTTGTRPSLRRLPRPDGGVGEESARKARPSSGRTSRQRQVTGAAVHQARLVRDPGEVSVTTSRPAESSPAVAPSPLC